MKKTLIVALCGLVFAIAPIAQACEKCSPFAPAPSIETEIPLKHPYAEFALRLHRGELEPIMRVTPFQADHGNNSFSFAWEYSLKSKQWSPLASYRVGQLTGVPLLKTLDISAIGGVAGGSNGVPFVGGMLSKSFQIANEASLLLGLTGRITQSRPPQIGGIVFGLSFDFNSR